MHILGLHFAVVNAFLIRLTVAVYSDFRVKDLHAIVSENSSEFLFWISVVLALFSTALVIEKAARNALQSEVELPRFKKWLSIIMRFSLARGLTLGLMLFEFAFDSNLKARLLWIQAYVFWFLGCISWMLGSSLIPQIFLISAITTMSIAGIIFYKGQISSFRFIENVSPNKASYGLIIFLATFTMLFLRDVSSGLLLLILSTAFYLLQLLPQKRITREN